MDSHSSIKIVRKQRLYPVVEFSPAVQKSLYQASLGEYSVEEPKERLVNLKANLKQTRSDYQLDERVRYKSPNPKILVPTEFERMERRLISRHHDFDLFESIADLLQYVALGSVESLLERNKCVHMSGFDPELHVFYPKEMADCYISHYRLYSSQFWDSFVKQLIPENNASQYLIFRSVDEDTKVFLGIGRFKDLFVLNKRHFVLLEDADKELLSRAFREADNRCSS